jgi:hypothetical protein
VEAPKTKTKKPIRLGTHLGFVSCYFKIAAIFTSGSAFGRTYTPACSYTQVLLATCNVKTNNWIQVRFSQHIFPGFAAKILRCPMYSKDMLNAWRKCVLLKRLSKKILLRVWCRITPPKDSTVGGQFFWWEHGWVTIHPRTSPSHIYRAPSRPHAGVVRHTKAFVFV